VVVLRLTKDEARRIAVNILGLARGKRLAGRALPGTTKTRAR
jgi:hypothetical protein